MRVERYIKKLSRLDKDKIVNDPDLLNVLTIT